MEAVNRRSEVLNPPRRRFLGFSSTPRRSHLDSASYRSLVRIFSHCLDHSLVPLQPCPKDSVSRTDIPRPVEDPTSAQRRSQLLREPLGGENDNVATLIEKSKDGDRYVNAGGREENPAVGAKLLGTGLIDFDPSDENEMEVRVNSDVLSGFMFGCGRLVGAPNVEIPSSGELNGGSEDTVHETNARTELENLKARVYGSEDGASHSCEVWASDKGPLVSSENKSPEESVPSSLKEFADERIRVAERDDLVRSKPVEDVEKLKLVEIQDMNYKVEEKKEEPVKQLEYVHSTNSIDRFGLRNFEDNQTSSINHQNGGRDIEEGEISDDIQELEESVDIINEGEVLKNKKSDGASVDHFNDALSRIAVQCKEEESKHGAENNLSAIGRRGASINYDDNLSDTFDEEYNDVAINENKKIVEAREKRKRGTLTKERKEKKKCAKKRKRAQKNREQGVKKLKLHPVVKPKEVKYCNFYLMGRCQQGSLCKFSHDITPLTKSMPCKHFACNSCLKGDDCPFDHELSKYPCHNYVSTGTCIRGDRCKFSHKVPTTDASSSAINKIDSGLSVEKLKLIKQPVRVKYSSPGIVSLENKTNGDPSMTLKLPKTASRMPKGIRFLSFGTPPIDSSNKAQQSSSVGMPGLGSYNQQKQDNLSRDSFSPLKPEMSNKSVCVSAPRGSTIKGSAAYSSGGMLNCEVSDATRILQEFLFCNTT